MNHETRVKIAKQHGDMTKAEKDQALTVRKANQLIQKNRFDMTVREQRLLLYCISRIKPTDKGNEVFKISIRDVCAACGIEDNVTGGAYAAMKEALKKLDSFNFYMKDDDGRDHLVHWIEHVVIDPERKNRACVQFNFDPRIVPYLFEVRTRFTQYQLGGVLQMKSVYGIRLFELAKSYENMREKTFDLKELRYLLGAETKAYDKYSFLKMRVLDPAVNELRTYSDLKVDYIPLHDGRPIQEGKRDKVTGIKLIISNGANERSERWWEQIDRERHPERYQ